GAGEEEMEAAAARQLAGGIGEWPVAGLQVGQGGVAAVAGIDIDDEEAGGGAGGGEGGGGPPGPPAGGGGGVGRGGPVAGAGGGGCWRRLGVGGCWRGGPRWRAGSGEGWVGGHAQSLESGVTSQQGKTAHWWER